jgi:hypothetical protein
MRPASRRAKELLARAQQAMGGADKLAAVTDYVQELAYQFDVSAGGARIDMTERWLAPGYLRQDSTSAPASCPSIATERWAGLLPETPPTRSPGFN